MSSQTDLLTPFSPGPFAPGTPGLHAGDHLTAAEFERRFDATTGLKKAELLEGVVYRPPPVSEESHGALHFEFITWLGIFKAKTPGTAGADNATLRLDGKNLTQPDALLRILPECGGSSRRSAEGGYIEGPVELVAEVAASSASYDLHIKMDVYRRAGVQEYIVWRVGDRAIDWFVLRDGNYERLPSSAAGLLKSAIFPGLWLDSFAMLNGNLDLVIDTQLQGIASPEHAAFVIRLANTPGRSQ